MFNLTVFTYFFYLASLLSISAFQLLPVTLQNASVQPTTVTTTKPHATNVTLKQPSFIRTYNESEDDLNITIILLQTSVRCHCRYDFNTIYFDAVDPFVDFAEDLEGYKCEGDKSCVGKFCVKKTFVFARWYGGSNKTGSLIHRHCIQQFSHENKETERLEIANATQQKADHDFIANPKLNLTLVDVYFCNSDFCYNHASNSGYSLAHVIAIMLLCTIFS